MPERIQPTVDFKEIPRINTHQEWQSALTRLSSNLEQTLRRTYFSRTQPNDLATIITASPLGKGLSGEQLLQFSSYAAAIARRSTTGQQELSNLSFAKRLTTNQQELINLSLGIPTSKQIIDTSCVNPDGKQETSRLNIKRGMLTPPDFFIYFDDMPADKLHNIFVLNPLQLKAFTEGRYAHLASAAAILDITVSAYGSASMPRKPLSGNLTIGAHFICKRERTRRNTGELELDTIFTMHNYWSEESVSQIDAGINLLGLSRMNAYWLEVKNLSNPYSGGTASSK